jgi:GT2 family glycosyltransferase
MAPATATDPERAPAISLIMTVRDGARYIAHALDSVRGQTFADWELVVWDDGSTDATLAIARAHAAADPRIRVFSGDARGRRAALVDAHAQARGTFLGWLDADDSLAPETLARTYAVITRSRCALVYTDHIVVGPDGTSRGLGRRSQIPYSPHRLLLDFITFHFRLFSREVFERAGGIHPDFEIAIDYDLCLRICELGRIVHLAEPLYFYRVHDEQLSTQRRAEQTEASARAIRAALARRGSVYSLVVDRGQRFRLVPVAQRQSRSPASWVRLAMATFVPALRTRQQAAARVVGMWPASRHSAYRDLLATALEQAGLATRALPRTLAAFMRAVWTGQAGDVLHVAGFAPLLHAPDRGTALARCHLFVRTIDHALARGMRVVWTTPGPLSTHARHGDAEAWCRRALATRCHAIVTHWRPDLQVLRALGAGDRAVFMPHPDVADAFPTMTREHARMQLGIDRERDVMLNIGEGAAGLALAPDIDQRSPRDVAVHLAAADAVTFTSAAAVTSTGIAAAQAATLPIHGVADLGAATGDGRHSWDAVVAAVVG